MRRLKKRANIFTLEGEIADAQPVVEAAQESRGVADADHSPPGDQVAETIQKAGEVQTLQPRRWRGIDLRAAWRRVGRWWRGRNYEPARPQPLTAPLPSSPRAHARA
jgi:hypothetical protein